MKRISRMTAALALCASLGSAVCSAQGLPHKKKLIEYGWDVPTPSYVRQNIRQMEALPFDGIIMYLPNDGAAFRSVFRVEKWDEARFAAVLDDLRSIEWQRFTDNFVIVWADSNMDWFNDDDWKVVLDHVGMMAEAAVAGRCKGLCFDAEPYGSSPWSYLDAAHRGEKSFDEYQAQVRKRGAEFMRAITDKMPNVTIHTFFLLSLFQQVAAERDPARRAELLSHHSYALLPAFLNGLLDAVGPNVTITDGNEPAYYYTDPCSYYKAYHQMRQGALALVAPENVRKYETQVQVSQALYVDQVFDLRQGMKLLSSALSPGQRDRWFEQNVFYALATADEYVWCYSERMNWWKNQGVPLGLQDAIESARRKIAEGAPLGFDVSDELAAAEKARRSELESKIARRTASIPKLPKGTAAPVIDGKLDDAAWQAAAPLDPFLPYVTSASETVHAATHVRVTYDEDKLYLAFQCDEPQPAAMRVLGSGRDDAQIWMGDSVDVFLSLSQNPVPFVHFILNPANLKWDAYCTDVNTQLEYNPTWQSATAQGDGGWSAEIALPWKEIRVPAPQPGSRHRANVGRHRIPGQERTSWSQVMEGFVAPQYFGTWIFEAAAK